MVMQGGGGQLWRRGALRIILEVANALAQRQDHPQHARAVVEGLLQFPRLPRGDDVVVAVALFVVIVVVVISL